jgi:hypothetical protein
MSGAHERIIAAAAKAELSPMGFKRKGRSRLWVLDHGHWLNTVGFVPSRWSISVDLDNAAHWIWAGHGFMSLDYVVRGRHADFETEEQFSAALADIAHEAASEALAIEEKFSSFEETASFAIDRARGSERMGPSWFGYQAGIAAGILGDMTLAESFFRHISDGRVLPHAQRFLAVIGEHSRFLSEVNLAVAEQRTALKLEPLESDAF